MKYAIVANGCQVRFKTKNNAFAVTAEANNILHIEHFSSNSSFLGFTKISIVKTRPYQVITSTLCGAVSRRAVHSLLLTAHHARSEDKENFIIKTLASQIQAYFRFETTDDRSYRIAIGEFGVIISYVPEEKHLASLRSARVLFHSVLIYQEGTLQLLQVDNQAPIVFTIGTPANERATNDLLQDLYQIAAQIVEMREYHMIRANYHLGRSMLAALAKASHHNAYSGSWFNPLFLAIAALLSSFSMADGSTKTPFDKAILVIAMIGGAVFNFLGGCGFEGFSREQWFSLLAGLLSAISPAVLTLFGVIGLVKSEVFGRAFGSICAVANFALSAALGTEGVQGVAGAIKDFFWSSDSKILAIVEIVIYSILAVYLSLARTQASMRLTMCHLESDCTASRSNHSAATYWPILSVSALCNLPEAAMFLMSYLRTRKRVTDSIITNNYPTDWGHRVSHGVALVLAFSFYSVFKSMGDAAWAESFDEFFAGIEGPLAGLFRTNANSFLTPGVPIGAAAALLVAPTGDTVHTMAVVLGNGIVATPDALRRAAAATPDKVAQLYGAIARRLCSIQEERQPLLSPDLDAVVAE